MEKFDIAIRENKIGKSVEKTVNARDLWKKLGSKQEFANWIKNRIEQYGFEKGKDYYVDKFIKIIRAKGGSSRSREVIDYIISLDMAKELAMVESNEAGRAVRRYFIAVEKEYRRLSVAKEERLQERIKDLLPGAKKRRFEDNLIRFLSQLTRQNEIILNSIRDSITTDRDGEIVDMVISILKKILKKKGAVRLSPQMNEAFGEFREYFSEYCSVRNEQDWRILSSYRGTDKIVRALYNLIKDCWPDKRIAAITTQS
jgi:phage anti-repressor protein